MGMFANLMSKVFGHSATAGTSAAPGAAAVTPGTGGPSAPATPSAAVPASAAPPGAGAASVSAASPGAPAPAVVDVTAILDGLAAKNPEKLDWKRSIVDLMKLVGMDSSLAARKELATPIPRLGIKPPMY